jgi:hypothetical protein
MRASDIERLRYKALNDQYLAEPEAVIVAVVSAGYNIELQSALSTALKYDPQCSRTICVVTKPDLLEQGSNMERAAMELVETVHSGQGAYVLRNRTFAERVCSQESRSRKEGNFFSQGVRAQFPAQSRGAKALKSKLHKLYLEKVAMHGYVIIATVRCAINECQSAIEELTTASLSHQRTEFSQVLSALYNVLKEGLSPHCKYEGMFYSSTTDGLDEKAKKCRAFVEAIKQEFVKEMWDAGELTHIVPFKSSSGVSDRGQVQMSKSTFINKRLADVKKLTPQLSNSPARPLVSSLLIAQTSRWEGIGVKYLEKVLQATRKFMLAGTSFVLKDKAKDNFVQKLVDTHLIDIEKAAKRMLDSITRSRKEGLLQTTNVHYWTTNFKNFREETLRAVTGSTNSYDALDPFTTDVLKLSNKLSANLAEKQDAQTAGEAVDCMLAHYRVSSCRILVRSRLKLTPSRLHKRRSWTTLRRCVSRLSS